MTDAARAKEELAVKLSKHLPDGCCPDFGVLLNEVELHVASQTAALRAALTKEHQLRSPSHFPLTLDEICSTCALLAAREDRG